jgi:hypothetical protein
MTGAIFASAASPYPHIIAADAYAVELVVKWATAIISIMDAIIADLNLGHNGSCHKGKGRKNGMEVHNSSGLVKSREDWKIKVCFLSKLARRAWV